MRKINKLGRRAAALVLAVGLTLSTAAPVLAVDADEVQTPAAQTEQQETNTEADEADVDTELLDAAANDARNSVRVPNVGLTHPVDHVHAKAMLGLLEPVATQGCPQTVLERLVEGTLEEGHCAWEDRKSTL